MSKERSRSQLYSSGIADLWEHACLLYHSYEWQSAADAFSELEQYTSTDGEKQIFALNKGLIEARLGDLDLALMTFTKALEYDEGHPITHFLLGLMYAETKNYAKGKTQFEHCLNGLNANAHEYQTDMGSFNLNRPMIQENIDHMRSRLIATTAGHGRTQHLRTCLNILPADVLFEPPSRSMCTSQIDGRSSIEPGLISETHDHSDEQVQDPISQASRPLHVDGHDVDSLHLVEDTERNLAIAPQKDTLKNVRRYKKLAPRDARVHNGSMQELSRFLRHAGPSGESTVTVDRMYMQRLLQGNTHDRPLVRSRSQDSVQPKRHGDDFESLLGLYTGASTRRRSLSTTIDSTVSDAMTVRQTVSPERTTTRVSDRTTTDPGRLLKPQRSFREGAQRWLHPSWSHKLATREQDNVTTTCARDRSRGTVMSSDGISLPSVVSSMDIFNIGRLRSGRR